MTESKKATYVSLVQARRELLEICNTDLAPNVLLLSPPEEVERQLRIQLLRVVKLLGFTDILA